MNTETDDGDVVVLVPDNDNAAATGSDATPATAGSRKKRPKVKPPRRVAARAAERSKKAPKTLKAGAEKKATASKAPKAPKAEKKAKAPKAPKAEKKTKAPKAPKAEKKAKAPKAPKAAKAPKKPKRPAGTKAQTQLTLDAFKLILNAAKEDGCNAADVMRQAAHAYLDKRFGTSYIKDAKEEAKAAAKAAA